MSRYALIFANGDVNDGPMVQAALRTALDHTPLVIAADGGARIALHFGLDVHIVIGDLDSLDAAELRALRSQGAAIQEFPPEKNETDLELALHRACEANATWIRIIGGVGGRLDQTLGNLYLMALPILQGCDIRLVAGRQEAWLLYPGEHRITGAPGDTVSLIPLGGAVHNVRTERLYYPLCDETLMFGPARGMSNVMNAEDARISITEGVLLIVHTIGKA